MENNSIVFKFIFFCMNKIYRKKTQFKNLKNGIIFHRKNERLFIKQFALFLIYKYQQITYVQRK